MMKKTVGHRESTSVSAISCKNYLKNRYLVYNRRKEIVAKKKSKDELKHQEIICGQKVLIGLVYVHILYMNEQLSSLIRTW